MSVIMKCVVLAADTKVPGAIANKNKIPTALRDCLLTQKLIITEVAAACMPEQREQNREQSKTVSNTYSETENAMYQQPFLLIGEKKSFLLEGHTNTCSQSSAGPSEQVTRNLTNKKLH